MQGGSATIPTTKDLKTSMARGAVARIIGQGVSFAVRMGYLVVMARILSPTDFGLFTMVLVVTGILDIIVYGGLTMSAVQKHEITQDEISNLFWLNVLLSITLAAICFLCGPLLVHFYGEPRVWWIASVLLVGLIVGSAGSQHMAIMQRQLRYTELTAIDVVGSLSSTIIGISMAVAGCGYWALVVGAVTLPIVNTLCVWWVSGWRPSAPSRSVDVRPMVRYGITVVSNGLVVYFAYNTEKILLGRFWGVELLGLYGRANQLIGLPIAQLHSAIGGVAFAGLARVQNDPERYRRYFLKIYALAVSLTAPVTLFCAVYAEDIILVALGPKWIEAAPLFRALAPTVLVFGFINPMAWLLQSSGLQARSLMMAFVIAPLCIVSYLIGLPYGAIGVAICYSLALTLWLVPHLIWAMHGTPIALRDLFHSTWRPIVAGMLAAAVAGLGKFYLADSISVVRLAGGGTAMAVVYGWTLLVLFGQKSYFADILATLRPGNAANAVAH